MLNRLIISFSLCILSAHTILAQQDNIGSGRAIVFDGIDDLIDLGDTYHDVNLPFSISAWLFIDPSVTFPVPIFVSNDNDPIYRGFWFFISQNLIWCEFGDGNGGSNPAFRRGKQASLNNITGRWINVCAVMKGPFDINLFVNGINVGGNSMGGSNFPMVSSFTGDHPKIGYFLSNDVTYRFKGSMDEVRLWNKALTEAEVRGNMCTSLTGNESGLIGYWNFNETSGGIVSDISSRESHGVLKGNPTRVFSGAPIGDQSLYNYRADWTGISVEINDGDDRMIVSNVKNNPEGIHLYKVTKVPSQVSGLDLSQSNKPYFGVFEAALDTDNSFDAVFLFQNKILCNVNERADNSEASWIKKGLPILARSERAEYVKVPGTVTGPTLGSDFFSCQENQAELDSKVADIDATFQWSTGETTSKITISQSGTYWVKVFGACGVSSDTIKVNFLQPPLNFSLGEDQQLCPMNSTLLKAYSSSRDFEFKWQDGTEAASFIANDYGTFWVTAKNACGEASDTITFEKRILKLDSIPNVITPNGDFKNEFFIVDKDESDEVLLLIVNRWGKQVYQSNNYKNNWNGDELATGVYFYTISGRCVNTIKGSISLIR